MGSHWGPTHFVILTSMYQGIIRLRSSAEILDFLKWLIYITAFKDPTAEPCRSIHTEYYKG